MTPDHPAEDAREGLSEGEVERLRDVLATCTCTPFPQGTGPEIDCPMHGRADYQAQAIAPVVAKLIAAAEQEVKARVEAIHVPASEPGIVWDWCAGCGRTMPCATLRALGGTADGQGT